MQYIKDRTECFDDYFPYALLHDMKISCSSSLFLTITIEFLPFSFLSMNKTLANNE